MSSHRRHPAYLAFLVHRLSGVGLALFLPLHFLALGLALEGASELDHFLHWSERPLVQLAELVLVFLLAVHLAGGLRLLTLELLGWTTKQHALIVAALVVAVMISAGFALNLWR